MVIKWYGIKTISNNLMEFYYTYIHVEAKWLLNTGLNNIVVAVGGFEIIDRNWSE